MKAKEFLDSIIDEQKVVVDEPVLNGIQLQLVMDQIKFVHDRYKDLYNTLVNISHDAESYKKRKLHKMIDHVVSKQKELDYFYKHFNK